MNTQELSEKFKALGLNQFEAIILAHLVELPEINVTDLSKRTEIPRGSIYRHLFNLEEQGYIEWILDTKGKKVSLSNLSALSHIIDESRKELDQKKELLVEIEKEVSDKRELSQFKPIIRYYEGKSGIKQLIWNTLKSDTVIKVYTNAFRKELLGESWLTDYTLEFVKRNLKDKVLGDENYAKDFYKKYGSRQKYFAPIADFSKISQERILKSPLLNIQGEIYIYDDVVASYSWENGSLTGSEIKSKYISTTQSSIFDLLWSQTSEKDSIDFYK